MTKLAYIILGGAICLLTAAPHISATEVIASTNQGDILQYNTATGSYSLLATNQAVIWGLGYTSSGTLYANDSSSSPNTGFYRVDPNTGKLTLLGTIGGSTAGAGTITSSVSGGTLYYVSESNYLYTLNPSHGAPTAVGVLGYNVSGSNDASFAANGNLYATSNENFYEINPVTGAATLIGDTGRQLQSLIPGDGGLYGFSGESMYSINLLTGGLTFIRNTPSSLGNFDAGVQLLSPAVVAPEPSSALLASCGVLLGVALRKGHRAVKRIRACSHH